jgi:endonuclease/exonuclease/phosphatase family metal-dependent hydrolase
MPRLAPSLCLLLLVSVTRLQAQSAIATDEGIKHINWKDAKDAIGQTVFVSGKVVTVGGTDRITFINFDTERPPVFAALVFRENRDKFPGDLRELYQGKIIEVRGLVVTYQDRPQIVITRPEQIKILDELPATEKVENKPKETWSGDPNQIVICTLNALNLFDDADDPYTTDEATPSKPREELDHLAATIRKVNADVVALQEVENRGYLERFVKLLLPDMGYNYIVQFDGNDPRGIDVALLSRAPIGEVTSRRHLRFIGPDGAERKFNRDVPAITVMPKGAEPFEIWPVHLKSKADSAETSEPIRLAEAAELRRLLDAKLAANPNARIIVAGDFNDTRDSGAVAKILGSGTTTMWAPEAKETEGSIPDPEYPDRQPIDFITCSSAMKALYIEESCQVMRAPAEQDGSDHDPVWAKFKLN